MGKSALSLLTNSIPEEFKVILPVACEVSFQKCSPMIEKSAPLTKEITIQIIMGSDILAK